MFYRLINFKGVGVFFLSNLFSFCKQEDWNGLALPSYRLTRKFSWQRGFGGAFEVPSLW